MTEAAHEDATVITSNVKTSQPHQEQDKHPLLSFKAPRRMISFKHEPPKNENAIEDDVKISVIGEQEELEAGQDDFQ